MHSRMTVLLVYSEKLFCVVTILFETRVGTVTPSIVVSGRVF